MARNRIHILLLVNCVVMAMAQDSEPTVTGVIMENNFIDPLETGGFINPFDEEIENIPRDLLLSWQVRRSIRKILAQMPYGWPEHNVPPLAPYISQNLTFHKNNSVFSTKTDFGSVRIDGLDNMEIKRMNVGLILKRVNFDFNFPNISYSGDFDTSNEINLQEIMNVTVRAKGAGKIKLDLENLRVTGSFRYKMPLFFGSAKIFNLRTEVSLGDVRSQLSGFINDIPIGEALNNLIATNILKYLNEYNFIWNGVIEKHVLPVVNTGLEGRTLWKIISGSISHYGGTFESGDLDNADIEELHQMLLRKQLTIA